MDTRKIGKFLRDLRHEQNLTQEELGEKLGATNKTISRWETGVYLPPAEMLVEISKLYNVSINEILSGERLATAEYHVKAEQNIVTSIKDTSVANKRSKKILIICLAVILALVVIGIILISILGTLSVTSGNNVYIYGDFTYEKRKNDGSKNDLYVKITGLSEQGKTKSVIVIPETIDGLRVSLVEDSGLFWHDPSLNFESQNLKKLYFPNSNIIVNYNTFDRCNNLKQTFVLKAVEDDALVLFNNANIYIFKDVYELEAPKWIVKEHKFAANVTYYYNYFGAENGGCYWLDQVDVGEKVEYLPPEPTRQGANKEYAFGGWYTDKDCVNKWSFDSDVMPETGELNLYAKWISLDETPTYKIECLFKQDGTVALKSFAGYYNDTKLVVPSHIDGRAVSEIYYNAFEQLDKRKITAIEIPSTVQTIDRYAFADFKAVQSINISGNKLQYIGYGAFANCSSLSSINLPASINGLSGCAFSGCTLLSAVNVNIDNTTFTSDDGVVYSKNKDELILYPCGKNDTTYTVDSQCTSIGQNAFVGSRLTSINLNNVSMVRKYAFQSCAQLTSIIGDKVKYVEMDALMDTAWLNNEISQSKEYISLGNVLYLYNGTAEDVVIKDYLSISDNAFRDNKFIKTLTIDTQKLISSDSGASNIGSNTFNGCTNLETVFIHNRFSIVYIGIGTFDNNAPKRKIYVPYYMHEYYAENELWQQYETTVHQTSITYDLDGKDIDSECPETIAYGRGLFLPEPTNQEYFYFAGWYLDKEYTNKLKGDTWLSYDDSVVIYAKWQPAVCTIKFCVDSKNEYNNFVLLNYTYGETVELPMAVHEGGYTFEYWCEDKELTKPVDFTLPNETRGNFTLYAKLRPNTYTVTYDLNTDDLDGITFDGTQKEVVFGQSYSLDVPIRKGYTFIDWYYFDGNNNKCYCAQNGMSWKIAGNVTLYAEWYKNPLISKEGGLS